tara:strand:+ start:253 stop:693 length:441 start_codon:yes stop_codon:yes gene_type:complete
MKTESSEEKRLRAINLAMKVDWPCMPQNLDNVDCFLSHLSKIERAQKIAHEIGYPYKKQDLVYVGRFLKELDGIKHTNQVLATMGMEPIDFTVRRQSVSEYLQEQDKEEEHEFLLNVLCTWQAKAKRSKKERRALQIMERITDLSL